MVCGIRYGPTTSPRMSISPPDTSAKYSWTLPCGSSPVEKNSCSNRSAAPSLISLVAEVDQHHDHAHGAAQRSPLQRRPLGHRRRGAEREVRARVDQAVVQADVVRAGQREVPADQVGGPVAQPLELVEELLLELGRGGDDAQVVDVVGVHGDGTQRLRHGMSLPPAAAVSAARWSGARRTPADTSGDEVTRIGAPGLPQPNLVRRRPTSAVRSARGENRRGPSAPSGLGPLDLVSLVPKPLRQAALDVVRGSG